MRKKFIIFIVIILNFALAAFIVSRPFIKEDTSEALDSFHNNAGKPKPVETKTAYNTYDGAPTTLTAEGNKITNATSNNVIFKGLMAPDLLVLNKQNKFNKAFFKGIRDTGANIIRIPVHPNLWIEDKDYLNRYIVPAVTWANELGMYAIIDLHYIGNIVTGEGKEMPKISVKPSELSKDFWIKISSNFKNNQNVIFEICNEPANIDAKQWSYYANELVDLIRNQGASQLIIVGGIQYSQDLSWVERFPISDDNIALATHIYPAHNKYNWKAWFGDASKTKPVIATEWGFIDENRGSTEQSYLIGDEKSYGKPFTDYLEENNIGWVACWFDDTWEPEMFKKDSKEYTNYGQFVINELNK